MASPHGVRLLAVGLGNRGREWVGTRHNAGFVGIEALASSLAASSWAPSAHRASVATASLLRATGGGRGKAEEGSPSSPLPSLRPPPIAQACADASLLLAKPQGYMNLSGKCVESLARHHSLPPSRILLLHDDLDLPLGKIKLKQGGSSAGHNGVASCERSLQSKDFWRMRIGIGRPKRKEDVAAFVLQSFTEEEELLLKRAVQVAADRFGLLLGADHLITQSSCSSFLNAIHNATSAPRAKRAASSAGDVSSSLNTKAQIAPPSDETMAASSPGSLPAASLNTPSNGKESKAPADHQAGQSSFTPESSKTDDSSNEIAPFPPHLQRSGASTSLESISISAPQPAMNAEAPPLKRFRTE